MTSPIQTTMFNGVTPFYNGVTSTSLRLVAAQSQALTRTPAGAGNQRLWTWAAWVKRGNLEASGGGVQTLFAAGDDANNQFLIQFANNGDAGDFLRVVEVQGGSVSVNLITTRIFRDISSWYHIQVVADTNQATNTDRIKIYVNGSRLTSFGTATFPGTRNQVTKINVAANHAIGRGGVSNDNYFDGYLAEVIFVDGTALSPDALGERKSNVWIPKEPNVTFGTNGFRLKFTSTAHDAPESEGTEDTDNIGADVSGEHNNWTALDSIRTSDCATPDNPENNFAVMQIGRRRKDVASPLPTFKEGNLRVEHGNAGGNRTESAASFKLPPTGKWYYEVLCVDQGGNSAYGYTAPSEFDQTLAGSAGYKGNGTIVRGEASGVTTVSGSSYTDGDVIGINIDLDNGTTDYSKNGTDQTQMTGVPTDRIYIPAMQDQNTGEHQANFGQDSSFSGAKTAGTNTDANGIGAFFGTPKTGHLAMCSANLPEPTVGGAAGAAANNYFQPVLYTGSGNSNNEIAVDFQPDWIWIKNRATTDPHVLTDSARGVTKEIQANEATEETTNDDGVTAITGSGFTVGDDLLYNTVNEAYVAWCWRANGGTATATISESGNNPAAVVQANPDAGFSIITYTGTGAAGTIAHGLGAKPAMIMIKNRDVGDNWSMYHQGNVHQDDGEDFSIVFNDNGARVDDATFFNDTAPTSTVFTINTNHSVNADGEAYVAYVFAEVDGYSAFGRYVGNGTADGAFVYTGFRPSYVSLRHIDNAGENNPIYDDERQFNGIVSILFQNLNVASIDASGDNAHIEFYANGFKLKSDNLNGNSKKYVYNAWADSPVKYANAF